MATRLTMGLALLGGLTLLAVGCTPEYPKCNKDENCREGEFCVNGQCQQCRDDKDCRAGEKCNKGRCDAVEGYCQTSDDCAGRKACKNNRCVACASDADCGPGKRCREGQCIAPGQCVTDDDCPEGQECQGGICASPSTDQAGPCQPEPVYFGFDQSVLSSTATAELQRAAQCIRSVAGRALRLEGHCDPRGTEEYNLALGDRRARSATSYLVRLGIPSSRLRAVSKGKLEATGTDEQSWALDRKAVFVWE